MITKKVKVRAKRFCMNCFQVNGCSCGKKHYHFYFSHTYRPHKLHKGKPNLSEWRLFLKACPAFFVCAKDYDWNPVLANKVSDFLKKIEYK